MNLSMRKRVREAVAAWPGVTEDISDRGGLTLRVGRIELGHLHGDTVAHLPFPRRERDHLIANHLATPHPVMPQSGWVEKVIRNETDADAAIALFRRNYARAMARRSSAAGPQTLRVTKTGG